MPARRAWSIRPRNTGNKPGARCTHESLLEAGQFIEVIEKRQGLKVACPEEVAWRQKWISDVQLAKLAEPLAKSQYGQYLQNLLKHGVQG